MRLGVLLLLLMLGLTGCGPPTIQMEMLEPASAHEVTQLRRLAVMHLRNDSGGVSTAALEQSLASVRLGEQQYFTLVDAHVLRNYLDNQGVAMTFNGQELRRYGKGSGADGAVLGTVNKDTWRDEHTMQERSVCIAENENGRCKKYGTRHVPCTRRTGTFSFTPKVVNVGTGQIIFTQEYTETRSDDACRGSSDSLASGSELVVAARNRAMQRFREAVAPHPVLVNIALLVEDDVPMTEPVKAEMARGVEFAKAGRIDRACNVWSAVETARHVGYALPYLRGVCAEQAGDLDVAERAYKEADKRAAQPVPAISEALSRVRRTRQNAELLRLQTE